MGNSDGLIEYLNDAVKNKTRFLQSLVHFLGTSYEVDNNLDSAIVKYNKAIELNPGYTKAYGNLGNIYTQQQDYAFSKRCSFNGYSN